MSSSCIYTSIVFIKDNVSLNHSVGLYSNFYFVNFAGKLYLISERFICENLYSVLSRDTKRDHNGYSSLSVPEVINHVSGVLEGMDILKEFGVWYIKFTFF